MGLWAHWPLTGGSLADVSGAGRDLTVVSGGLTGPVSSGLAAPTGGGSRLFGPHQAADSGPNQPYHGLVSPNLPACGTWTLEAWVRPNVAPPGLAHAYSIMQQRPGSNTWFWIDPGLHLWNYNGATFLSTGTIGAGTWTHVALSNDGTQGRFWIGGVQDPATIGSIFTLSGGWPLSVGYDPQDAGVVNFCDKVLDGYLADVKVWDAYQVPDPGTVTPAGGWSAGVIRR